MLVSAVEETIGAAQQCRVGAYQIRESAALREAGLFYDPGSLSDRGRATVYQYALDHQLDVYELDDFIEQVFFRVLVDLGGTCINFNTPFDVSRLAVRHNLAHSRAYRGGFTFVLSEDLRRPNVQIRHLNSAESLIQFTVPAEQPTPRGMRKRHLKVPAFRGWFCDVHTLAAALLEHRGDLRSLGKLLETPTQKGEADFEAEEITPEFLEYSIADVRLTWECFERLAAAYARLGLADTPLPKIYSAASIGKAHLDGMHVLPWREAQPDYAPDEIGRILSGYFGGRSEVHLRRSICRVLYADFLSMYGTCASLMNLSLFAAGSGIRARDATREVQQFIDRITPELLQRPETWRRLAVMVELEPDCDLFPVRAKYDGSAYTIGLNYYSTDGIRVWYPLADVLVAAVLGHKRPRITRAVAYEPEPPQPGLQAMDLMGNPAYRVDPRNDDVFRRLVELRSELKRRRDRARTAGDTKAALRLDAEQQAAKLVLNSVSYGIFIELNVTDFDALRELTCYGRGEPFSRRGHNIEEPGRFFHPLLAALITAGARLMLALAERQILAAGLDWVFCDTDSMAIACPPGMPQSEFVRRAKRVLTWFEPLKPYAIGEPLFKLEDANFAIGPHGRLTEELAALYCYAISDKRYALFNIDTDGRPILRKASAHGLGHLRPPYDEANAPSSIRPPALPLSDIGVTRWQYDLWYRIVEAALDGHPDQVRLDDLRGLDAPAVSRYAATTPELLRWFKPYNAGKPYREQVRPFGFLLAFQARPNLEPTFADVEGSRGSGHSATGLHAPAVVAPFARDPAVAARRAFDRVTGDPFPAERLLSYRQVLAQYHLHREAKLHGGDYLDAGHTTRRHVTPLGPICNIGKEANRWEEQFFVGANPEAQIDYGTTPGELSMYRDQVAARIAPFSVRRLAERARVSVGTVSNVRRRAGKQSRQTLVKLDRAASELEAEAGT